MKSRTNLARGLALSGLFAFSSMALSCDRGAATEAPGTSQAIVLSLQSVDCEGCMFNVIANVEKHPAVSSAHFHLATAELTIAYDPAQATPADLVALVKRNGYDSVEGGGRGTFLPEIEFPSNADVLKLETAGELDFGAHVVAGKLTVFDFYAQWCQPCRKVDEHLAGVMDARTDIAVRRVDIHAWDSEIATNFLAGNRALPLLVVFGPDGTKMGEVRGADTAALDEVLGQPAAPTPTAAPAPTAAPPPAEATPASG